MQTKKTAQDRHDRLLQHHRGDRKWRSTPTREAPGDREPPLRSRGRDRRDRPGLYLRHTSPSLSCAQNARGLSFARPCLARDGVARADGRTPICDLRGRRVGAGQRLRSGAPASVPARGRATRRAPDGRSVTLARRARSIGVCVSVSRATAGFVRKLKSMGVVAVRTFGDQTGMVTRATGALQGAAIASTAEGPCARAASRFRGVGCLRRRPVACVGHRAHDSVSGRSGTSAAPRSPGASHPVSLRL